MSRVFVDTSAWVALFEKSDDKHREALACLDRIRAQRLRLVMSDLVFGESITTALGRSGHRIAVNAGEYMLQSGIVEIVWLDEILKRRAWDYFERHADKDYSFVDCTSFVLMKDMKVTKYLSFDEHFKQAGFSALS